MNDQSSGAGAATICPDPTANPPENRAIAIQDDDLLQALRKTASHGPYQRTRLVFPRFVKQSFAALCGYQRVQNRLRCCYSMKTNPSRTIVVQARQSGFLAEVISAAEFERAIECGFPAEDIVYNGPVPVGACRQAPGHIFADSTEAYVAALQRFPHSRIGIRLRPPGIASHFGLPGEELDAFARVVQHSGRLELGVSYHVRPEDYGTYNFRTLAQAVMRCAEALGRTSGARVTTLDVGGGWRPDQLDGVIANGDLEWVQARVVEILPHVQHVFCEPGQALVTSTEALVAPILEVRKRGERTTAVIVDSGYPDVPQIHSFPHRLFLAGDGGVSPMTPGEGTIVGRTCLEYDIFSQSVDLNDCQVGAAVVVADVGAYDASMQFAFADGRRSDDMRHDG